MGRRRCSLLSRYSSAEAAFDFPCSWSSTTGSWTSTDGQHRDEDGAATETEEAQVISMSDRYTAQRKDGRDYSDRNIRPGNEKESARLAVLELQTDDDDEEEA